MQVSPWPFAAAAAAGTVTAAAASAVTVAKEQEETRTTHYEKQAAPLEEKEGSEREEDERHFHYRQEQNQQNDSSLCSHEALNSFASTSTTATATSNNIRKARRAKTIRITSMSLVSSESRASSSSSPSFSYYSSPGRSSSSTRNTFFSTTTAPSSSSASSSSTSIMSHHYTYNNTYETTKVTSFAGAFRRRLIVWFTSVWIATFLFLSLNGGDAANSDDLAAILSSLASTFQNAAIAGSGGGATNSLRHRQNVNFVGKENGRSAAAAIAAASSNTPHHFSARDYHGRGTASRRRVLLHHSLHQQWMQQLTKVVKQEQEEHENVTKTKIELLKSFASLKEQFQPNHQHFNQNQQQKSRRTKKMKKNTVDEQQSQLPLLDDLQHVFQKYLHPEVFRHNAFQLPDKAHTFHQAFPPFPDSLRHLQRRRLLDMFTNAFEAYMTISFFPTKGQMGELKPLSCQPGEFDLVKLPALTLIDTLDTLLLFHNFTEFARSVERIRQLATPPPQNQEQQQQESYPPKWTLFHLDVNVSLFETNIRVLGGLLSAHQLAQAYMTNRVDVRDVYEQEQAQGKSSPPFSVSLDGSGTIVKWGGYEQSSNYYIDEDDDDLHHDDEQNEIVEEEEEQHEQDQLVVLENEEEECPAIFLDDDDESLVHCATLVDGLPSLSLSLPICLPPSTTPFESSLTAAAMKDARRVAAALSNRTAAAAAQKKLLLRKKQQTQSTRVKNNNKESKSNKKGKPKKVPEQPWVYDGFLLELALDLGLRLLPAFDTRTGIPYGTVNLLTGVPPGETTVASLAGGGTLTLEMELLSRLTNDDRFGKAAKLATRALFLRRSGLDLLGKHIDVQQGHWTETLSGIGSNSDSFLEYMVKHFMLFPEDEDMWIMLIPIYTGVFNYSRAGEWYVDVDMMHGGIRSGQQRRILESLMAFYPGMQVLLGELSPAAKSLNSFFMVREWLGFLPERFHFGNWRVDAGRGAGKHPLRPELLESCYFMHQASKNVKASSGKQYRKRIRTTTKTTENNGATADSSDKLDDGIDTGSSNSGLEDSTGWLWAASFAIDKIEAITKADCGYAGVRDLTPQTTGNVEGAIPPKKAAPVHGSSTKGPPPPSNFDDFHLYDEMPSFFLSETLKYLYLMFDEENILHQDDDRQWIFTTEAHPIHNVPMNNKDAEERKEERLAHQIGSLKTLLQQRLQHGHTAEFNPLKRKSWNLAEEKWAERTTKVQYRHNTDQVYGSVVKDQAAMLNLVDRNHTIVQQFENRQMLSPFASNKAIMDPDFDEDTRQDDNVAHLGFTNLGLGPGTLFRKACPNVYTSDLLWMQALNGGSLDYSDIYVTVSRDEIAEHPNFLAVVGAAQALGMHGSGIYLYDIDEDNIACELFEQSEAGAGVDADAETSVPDPEFQNLPKVFEITSDIGRFQIAPFREGDGFFIQHADTAETLVVSFIRENQGTSPGFTMTYYAIPKEGTPSGLSDDMPESAGFQATVQRIGARLQSMFIHGDRKPEDSEIDESFDRKVVVSDFDGNSFYCEVAVVEKYQNEEGVTVEEILDDYPCAPAMFGPTNLARLGANDGICVEATALAPQHDDEFGCLREAATTDHQVQNEDHSSASSQERKDSNASIQILRRGGCSFYSKATNQKLFKKSDGVIVINTEETELFVMSFGEEGEFIVEPDQVPTTVLVTAADGEDILAKMTMDANEKEVSVVVRISISRMKGIGQQLAENEVMVWPAVHGYPDYLQVYAKGGWGMQAKKRESTGEWQLQLLRHDLENQVTGN